MGERPHPRQRHLRERLLPQHARPVLFHHAALQLHAQLPQLLDRRQFRLRLSQPLRGDTLGGRARLHPEQRNLRGPARPHPRQPDRDRQSQLSRLRHGSRAAVLIADDQRDGKLVAGHENISSIYRDRVHRGHGFKL